MINYSGEILTYADIFEKLRKSNPEALNGAIDYRPGIGVGIIVYYEDGSKKMVDYDPIEDKVVIVEEQIAMVEEEHLEGGDETC